MYIIDEDWTYEKTKVNGSIGWKSSKLGTEAQQFTPSKGKEGGIRFQSE